MRAESPAAVENTRAGQREGDGGGLGCAEVGDGQVLHAVYGEAHEVEQERGDGGRDEG